MTPLDIIVLVLIGGFGIRGFMVGFVTEILGLAALVAAIVAVRLLHAPFTLWLTPKLGTDYGAAILAFALIFGLVYGIGNAMARALGRRTRSSVLGMVDRLLGLGFGAIKGLLIATVLFLCFTLIFNALNGANTPRPDWVRFARSYPLLNASSDSMTAWMEENNVRGGLLHMGPHDDGDVD